MTAAQHSFNLTEAVADFVVASGQRLLGEAEVALARRAFLDTLAVMLAARSEAVCGILKQASPKLTGAAATSSVLLDTSYRLPAADAALINATAAHALDYDDVAFRSHPSAVLVPTLLAEGEAMHSDGLQLLRAYRVGFEVWGELHQREPDAIHDKGWHPTSALGATACVAALCALRGLDKASTARALSLSASFSGGVVANFGTMTKALHAGRAAQSAFVVMDLAGRGVTAGADALGGPQGLLASLSPKGAVDLASLTRFDVTPRFNATTLTFKKYPVCFAAHRVIDAALEICSRADFSPQQVSKISISLRQTQGRLLSYHRPVNALQAKFSAEFGVAAALAFGSLGLVELVDDRVQSATIRHLIDRCEFQLVEGSCDRLQVTLLDGSIFDSGEIDRVALVEDSTLKFDDCCASVNFDGSLLRAVLERFEVVQDVNQLAAASSAQPMPHLSALHRHEVLHRVFAS